MSAGAARGRTGSIDRSLRLRVRIFAVIFVVALVIVVLDLVALGTKAVVPVLLTAAISTVIGVLASRMMRLSLDETSGTVVGRVDALGVVILIGYIAAVVFRGQLIDLWVAAPYVSVCGVAALAGIMAGQVLGTVHGLTRMLQMAGLDRLAGQQDGSGPG